MGDDGFFKPKTMVGTLSDTTNLDFSVMDDLLYDGFWLETTDESNFWQPCSTAPTDLNPSFFFPSSETTSFTTNPSTTFSKETEKPSIPPFTFPGMDDLSGKRASIPSVSLGQSTDFLFEETQVSKRLWVAPTRNRIRSVSVRKKLVQAVNHLKDSIRESDVLVQIWVPVQRGGKQVLTTNNQPFSLNPNCKNLAEYRDVSRNFHFAADEDSKESAGLPGRVFLKKLPDWTPDVQFFKREEYPRKNHAQQCDVRGSLALPVFERGSGKCLGVVEIVTTSRKVNCRPDIETVCKALEAVDLKSTDMLEQGPPNMEDCNESYQSVLMEIRNVLRCVCDTHKLPLAQTWAPCVQQGKGGCRHSDENYNHCVSTLDSACYVADAEVAGFHEACSEYHLLKGEGIAGKAFLTNQPCFSANITEFSKTEYPLAHHARVFNLHAAVAIRLRSTYTAAADFVLEFFLPINCKGPEDQRQMLDSLSSVVERTCQSLRVVTDQELAREISAREASSFLSDAKRPRLEDFPSKEAPSSPSSWITQMMEPQHKGKGVAVALGYEKEEPGEFNMTTQWDKPGAEFNHAPAFLEHDKHRQQQDSGSKDGSGSFFLTSGPHPAGTKSNTEKRRTKTEKTISLQVLRQYFAGSLKDAAKNIGVCPTTLKRICRQHGITRWPSRKIKKVGHSLRKLQLVIDSVQGTEGSIQLSSFYNNFPELSSSNAPETIHLPTSTVGGELQPGNNQPEGTLLSPATTSSGSHSSSSSYCCSTGVKQSSFPVNGSSSGDALSAEQNEGMLKRARSNAELHQLSQEDSKLLVRSYSQKIYSDHVSNEASPVPKISSKAQDVGNFRVKASLNDEKIRLTLQPHWGFRELQQEVLRRFNIDNGSRVDLKYLDDDSEWVLLTCDADLEECKDIHTSLKSRTIRLSLNQAYYHPSLGSSFGSNGPI